MARRAHLSASPNAFRVAWKEGSSLLLTPELCKVSTGAGGSCRALLASSRTSALVAAKSFETCNAIGSRMKTLCDGQSTGSVVTFWVAASACGIRLKKMLLDSLFLGSPPLDLSLLDPVLRWSVASLSRWNKAINDRYRFFGRFTKTGIPPANCWRALSFRDTKTSFAYADLSSAPRQL